ncbi:diguanylate cyclase [Alloactinosynnema sp. L-07]|uniref:GGDEF domain-containing protein n=1 Tax=Alloactinosynnema sp. L-07 TaxID=1653480 RepID=UPI00155F5BD0|nr:GGDEF domain-containing protein [Alloactinosynnema sp. L-07]
MLLIDMIGAILVALRTHDESSLVLTDWWRFGCLLAATIVYLWWTRPVEERRRAERLQKRKVEHVDMSTIWCVAAALTLPMSLAVAVVLVIQAARYLVARKPIGLWISTTSTIVMSVLATGWIRDSLSGGTWLTEGMNTDPITGLRNGLLLILVIPGYFLAAAIPVGGYRAIRIRYGPEDADNVERRVTLGRTIGTRKDNRQIVIGIVVGIVAGVINLVAPPFLVVIMVGAIVVIELVTENGVLRVAALVDNLTGLPNRHAFKPEAKFHLTVDQGLDQTTSLLLVDLDLFKGFNTAFGHAGGDQVLVKVGRILSRAIRSSDLIARWGGEEFVVLLPNTGTADAVDVANNLRNAVAEITTTATRPAGGDNFKIGKGTAWPITASIGVATSPRHAQDLATLHDLADRALRVAKDAGRNRVEVAPVTHTPNRALVTTSA